MRCSRSSAVKEAVGDGVVVVGVSLFSLDSVVPKD